MRNPDVSSVGNANAMNSRKIAIVGSGIAGLSAAWLLARDNRVTLFEKAADLGGHTNTVTVQTGDGAVAVDTGFIVFNERNYPNLTALFDHLGVTTSPSSMSFAASIRDGRMEYSGAHLNGLFGQRRNIVRLEHWQLVRDILRFFRDAQAEVASVGPDVTIGEFLQRFGYSRTFVADHILPISAAIWSTPARNMLDFPARTFVEFFSNHGLMQVSGRPSWRTVTGGSRNYVERMLADVPLDIRTNARIETVCRHFGGVEIFHAGGHREHFDELVLACHADEALALLSDATGAEREVLSAFRFTPNRAVLHTDPGFMPRRKRLWSSWNYISGGRAEEEKLSVTYWMNRLQPLPTSENLFVTLNPHGDFAPESVRYDTTYMHPLFDARAIAAQKRLWQVQGVQNTWFAGAWMGYGFHEDGLQAGLEVAERIGTAKRPWSVPGHRARIAHNWAEGERVLWAAE